LAQAFRGAVVEAGAGTPVMAAELLLLDADRATVASTLSDSAGRFAVRAPAPGAYRLRIERVGYARVESQPIPVGRGEVVDVEVTLDVQAVLLDAIVVTERREYAEHAREYFDRLERRNASLGRFITRDDIEERRLPNVSSYLIGVTRVHLRYDRFGQPHVIMGAGTTRCTPTIYIDGLTASDDLYSIPVDQLISPDEIEGIEVYRSSLEAPPEYWDRSGCGSILIWTRRIVPGRDGFSWTKTLIGIGLFGVLFLFGFQ
ncbi:MAG: carboxypeptidase regulatory-like domain-containing protein, partial [Longimicrobiales bacterium]